MPESATIYRRPAELLQHLIRFDTTNPPGNEGECIGYIDGLLRDLDIETKLLQKVPGRPNLVARIEGDGTAPPLLLQGHIDVVTTAGQQWTHPPFDGEIIDDYVWGRGALDMKGGVAMMLAAFMRAKVEDISLPGDVILCILADEEAGGDVGAQFLVEEHAELFRDVRYAIGEFGGFTLYLGGKRFYPIMVAEKQICWLKATLQGPAGHGAFPVQGGAMAKAGVLLTTLDRKPLPIHITPIFRQMVETISAELSFPAKTLLRQLLNPLLAGRMLSLLGDKGKLFSTLMRNTSSPTIFHGSNKINVIPGEVVVELDGRLLPGFTPEDIIRELRAVVGKEVHFEIVRHDPGPAKPDLGWFDTLSSILREADPEGIPIPLLLSGVTDARFFSRLGIQTYGFLPLTLPETFNFTQTVHAADERIPVEALTFGTHCIYQALQRRL